jgi:hypothetical protein
MWLWDCAVPGRSAAGVCHDEQRALRAAETWMREHEAATALVAAVRLDAVELAYVPAGPVLEAARHGGNRIAWRAAGS